MSKCRSKLKSDRSVEAFAKPTHPGHHPEFRGTSTSLHRRLGDPHASCSTSATISTHANLSETMSKCTWKPSADGSVEQSRKPNDPGGQPEFRDTSASSHRRLRDPHASCSTRSPISTHANMSGTTSQCGPNVESDRSVEDFAKPNHPGRQSEIRDLSNGSHRRLRDPHALPFDPPPSSTFLNMSETMSQCRSTLKSDSWVEEFPKPEHPGHQAEFRDRSTRFDRRAGSPVLAWIDEHKARSPRLSTSPAISAHPPMPDTMGKWYFCFLFFCFFYLNMSETLSKCGANPKSDRSVQESPMENHRGHQ
jgi:hypothetical protein